MNLDEEKVSAQNNFNRLVAEIPVRLSEREDRFASMIERTKTNPAKKLESLYSFMTELYEFVSKYTPCKKGCSGCCHYSVTVSKVEIVHIEKNAKIKRNRSISPRQDFHGLQCPFLKQGVCSIYEARPFVCRKHVALTSTNTWCSPDISNNETFPLLHFSGINDAFEHIRSESASFEVYDIRQIFGHAAPNE
ncbi:MAG: YkgJ family cysteine cluster protein [Desulforudis sp.]|nr:MAG: YkgJ family cysteine cluster protein [Desulforudis sp.]